MDLPARGVAAAIRATLGRARAVGGIVPAILNHEKLISIIGMIINHQHATDLQLPSCSPQGEATY